jgi:large subunit ribosomal protein L25
MTTEAVSLDLTPREVMGKKVKQLRRAGITPVHLYGPGVEPRPLQCETPRLIEVLARAGGNTPITITIHGEQGERLAFAREIQWDPRRDDILHVDFLVAEATRPVSAQVPIVLIGQSPAARVSGGTVMQQLRDLSVQALPLEMPNELEVDLAELTEPDGVIRAADIRLPGNVTLLADPEEVVVRIEMPRVAVEEAALEEGVAEEAQAGTEDAPEDEAENP